MVQSHGIVTQEERGTEDHTALQWSDSDLAEFILMRHKFHLVKTTVMMFTRGMDPMLYTKRTQWSIKLKMGFTAVVGRTRDSLLEYTQTLQALLVYTPANIFA